MVEPAKASEHSLDCNACLCPCVKRLLHTDHTMSLCRFIYESAMPVSRLVRDLADKAQVCTQRSWKRPYGVGLLSGGYDQTGAKLYYNCPSGNYYEYKANAVGARSQVFTVSELLLYASHTNSSSC